jgi:hypothetical protein
MTERITVVFELFAEEPTADLYSIIYNGKNVGSIVVERGHEHNNVLNLSRKETYGVEILCRILNAVFCRFGPIQFKVENIKHD